MPPVSVVHACTHLRSLGGVQTLIRRHLKRDGDREVSSSATVWFERGPFGPEASGRPVFGLGLRWFHSGRTLRRRLRTLPPGFTDDGRIWTYHDLWGLPTAADLDGAGRRVGVIHSQWEGTEPVLQTIRGAVDGMLCISASSAELTASRLPPLAGERIALLPVPVDPPPETPGSWDRPPGELVVGYCGRIRNQQKRVDRIPGIAEALRAAGVPHRWEFLGDGPERGSLEKTLAARGIRTLFHGALSGDAYWKVLADWDAILFTSDYEGLPIAMLEAMSRGVVPVFPDVPCGGRDYTGRIAPELVYPAADLDAAARTLGWIQSLGMPARVQLRSRARDGMLAHTGDAYGKTFASFLQHLAALPRISASGTAARRTHPGERIPYALIARLAPGHALRRGYL
ncbi:MAG: glycosyltransferase [Verrucomicrobiales bacterium]|nr:glycosyltransferase [Verrucomicrobiales bacterium]